MAAAPTAARKLQRALASKSARSWECVRLAAALDLRALQTGLVGRVAPRAAERTINVLRKNHVRAYQRLQSSFASSTAACDCRFGSTSLSFPPQLAAARLPPRIQQLSQPRFLHPGPSLRKRAHRLTGPFRPLRNLRRAI